MIIHSHFFFFSFSKKICFKNCKIRKRSLIHSLESLSVQDFAFEKLMYLHTLCVWSYSKTLQAHTVIFTDTISWKLQTWIFFNFWKYVSKHICAVSSSPSIQIFSKVGSMSFPQCCSKVWAKEKKCWLALFYCKKLTEDFLAKMNMKECLAKTVLSV